MTKIAAAQQTKLTVSTMDALTNVALVMIANRPRYDVLRLLVQLGPLELVDDAADVDWYAGLAAEFLRNTRTEFGDDVADLLTDVIRYGNR